MTADLAVVITRLRPLTGAVTTVALSSVTGEPLPPWEPGAHVDLTLPSGRVRPYSLYGDPADRDRYRIVASGAAELSRLSSGQQVRLHGPRNTFPLRPAPAYLFLAHGLGIAPLLPMVRRAVERAAWWRLLHVGRGPDAMPFSGALKARYPDQVTVTPTGSPHPAELERLLSSSPADCPVYCCGTALVEAVQGRVPADRLHTDRYSAVATP
jgi:ferredoxin-NADP reductase